MKLSPWIPFKWLPPLFMWSNQEHKRQGNKYLCSRKTFVRWIWYGIICFQRIHFGFSSKHLAAGREKGVKKGPVQGSPPSIIQNLPSGQGRSHRCLPWAVGRLFEDVGFMSFIAKLDLWGYLITPDTSPEKALSLMKGFVSFLKHAPPAPCWWFTERSLSSLSQTFKILQISTLSHTTFHSLT